MFLSRRDVSTPVGMLEKLPLTFPDPIDNIEITFRRYTSFSVLVYKFSNFQTFEISISLLYHV